MRRQNRWGRSVPVATSAESGRLRKAARGERRPGRLRRGLRAGRRREGAAVPLPSGTAWEGAGGDLDGGGEPRAERRRNASGTAGGQGWGRGKGQPLQPHTARGDRTRRARTDSRRSPDTAARGENGAAVRGSPERRRRALRAAATDGGRDPQRPPRSAPRPPAQPPHSPGPLRAASTCAAGPAPVTSRAPPPRRRPRPPRAGPAHRHSVAGSARRRRCSGRGGQVRSDVTGRWAGNLPARVRGRAAGLRDVTAPCKERGAPHTPPHPRVPAVPRAAQSVPAHSGPRAASARRTTVPRRRGEGGRSVTAGQPIRTRPGLSQPCTRPPLIREGQRREVSTPTPPPTAPACCDGGCGRPREPLSCREAPRRPRAAPRALRRSRRAPRAALPAVILSGVTECRAATARRTAAAKAPVGHRSHPLRDGEPSEAPGNPSQRAARMREGDRK